MAEETPLLQDFVTPGQIKARRDMAEALLKQSMTPYEGRSGDVRAVSPLGGLNMMTDALVGSRMLNSAGGAERASEIGGQQARMDAPGTVPGTGRRSEADDSGAPGPIASFAPGGPNSMAPGAYAAAISAQESGGNYHAIGPKITKGSLIGDHAYGKYQIMGTNIPKWTQEILGRPMSIAEFLNNPQAQDAVYKGKFGQYVQQFGPEGAARAWLGGPGSVNHPGRADQLGTTVGSYGHNFMKLAGLPTGARPDTAAAPPSPEGGQALAFSGEPAETPVPTPGSPAAMSSALAGETKVAGGPTPVAPAFRPSGGIAHGVLPQFGTMTRQQFDRAMLSADPATRAIIQEQYYSQNQPKVAKDPLNRDVVIGRDGWQMLINPLIKSEQQIGDIKGPIFQQQQIGPGGRPYIERAPNRGAARPAAPTVPAATEDPVPSLKFAPEDKGVAAEALPAEITKGPEAAAAERGGMLGTPPPGSEKSLPFAETQLPNAPTGIAPGVESTPLEDMGIEQQAEWKRQFDLNKASAQHFNTLDADKVSKQNEQLQNNARDTIQLENYIGLGKKMLSDPRLQEMLGPGANLKMDWKSLLTFFGNKDAEAAVGLRQAFDKVTSSGIIGTLKADYGGLGQIRNKEIELSEKATSSPKNTVEANLAVLNIADRVVKQKQMLGKLANLYVQGQRWDADGKPIPGKTNERPTFAGLNEVTNEYLKNHPLFDDKDKGADGKTELDRYLDIFKSSEKTESKKRKSEALPPGGKPGKPGEPTTSAPPPPSGKRLAPHELPPGRLQ